MYVFVCLCVCGVHVCMCMCLCVCVSVSVVCCVFVCCWREGEHRHSLLPLGLRQVLSCRVQVEVSTQPAHSTHLQKNRCRRKHFVRILFLLYSVMSPFHHVCFFLVGFLLLVTSGWQYDEWVSRDMSNSPSPAYSSGASPSLAYNGLLYTATSNKS